MNAPLSSRRILRRVVRAGASRPRVTPRCAPPCCSAQPRAEHAAPSRPGIRLRISFCAGPILLMIAASVVVMQKGATIRRREIEQETIWRGNQYARAIRLYYHKTGHYPQTLDDLEKGMPDLHFLRQAYKNPTNPADGSWRFIYVNAAGQIIGSTKYANLQQMALMDANGGQLPTLQGQPGSPRSARVASLHSRQCRFAANTPAAIERRARPNDNSTGSTPPVTSRPIPRRRLRRTRTEILRTRRPAPAQR